MVIPLFNPYENVQYIWKIAQFLLADKVSAVRESSIQLVSYICLYLCEHTQHGRVLFFKLNSFLQTTHLLKHISTEQRQTQKCLVRLAERFAHSKLWKLRQTFALLSSELLQTKSVSNELFVFDIMPHLLDLSWDPVPNVRLVVARIIARHIITNGKLDRRLSRAELTNLSYFSQNISRMKRTNTELV